VADEVLQRELRGREVRRAADVREREAEVVARLQDVGEHEPSTSETSDAMMNQLIAFANTRPTDAAVAHVRDADDERREYERPDQHLDQAQEDVRQDRDVAGDLAAALLVRDRTEDHVADDDPEHERDQDDDRSGQFSLHRFPFPATFRRRHATPDSVAFLPGDVSIDHAARGARAGSARSSALQSWNSRMSNRGPSARFARSRSSRIFSMPIL
jgi:hypothetical protein